MDHVSCFRAQSEKWILCSHSSFQALLFVYTNFSRFFSHLDNGKKEIVVSQASWGCVCVVRALKSDQGDLIGSGCKNQPPTRMTERGEEDLGREGF